MNTKFNDVDIRVSEVDWKQRAAGLCLPDYAFIGGKRTSARHGETYPCINPATGQALVQVAACNAADVDDAVTSARHALGSGVWSQASPGHRKSVLLRFAEQIRVERIDLALMESLSMGKPVRDACHEVDDAAAFIAWFGETLDKLYGEVIPSELSSFAVATREPVGVVGLITPWNYPIEEAAIKLGPALAAGNCVILKPAEISPFSAIRLGELALKAGLPPGVLNVVPGLGAIAGKAIGLHGDIECVGFTGSTRVGKLLLRYAGESNMKRVWLECGGKSPNLVFADCGNLKFAAEEAARSVLRNQGQVCSAGSRVLVERTIADEFTGLLVAASKRYVPADPLDARTRMGPMASAEQYNKVQSYILLGLEEGANLILDGRMANQQEDVYFLGPSIFARVSNSMRIAREEIFGPVITLMCFDSEDEAIRIANDSPYGLVASLWTQDVSRAHRVARALQAGSVTINGVDAQSEAAPFGGTKQSGSGREHSLHAFDQYTNLKTTWLKF
jgi:gamma-glutamyl-gamma-aminobutyraldehyde dehydrogenase